jgi:hypothetical protein
MNQSVIKNPFVITFVYAIIMYIKLNIVIGESFGNSESKRIKCNIFFNIVQTTEEKDGC